MSAYAFPQTAEIPARHRRDALFGEQEVLLFGENTIQFEASGTPGVQHKPVLPDGFTLEARMRVPGAMAAPGRVRSLGVVAAAVLVVAIYVWLPLVFLARDLILQLVPAVLGATGGLLVIAAAVLAILQGTSVLHAGAGARHARRK
jgi:hypothetical protein